MENLSFFYKKYIIDGKKQDMTPAQMLGEVLCVNSECQSLESSNLEYSTSFIDTEDIIDESIDPIQLSLQYSPEEIPNYIGSCVALSKSAQDREFQMFNAESFTRSRIASALIDMLWLEGKFKLEDLVLWAKWEWDTSKIGNMAAFYHSCKAASEYIYDLGVKIKAYSFSEASGICKNMYFPNLGYEQDKSNVFQEEEYEPWIGELRKCPNHFVPHDSSTLLYIPFDTCSFKLGASILASSLSCNLAGVGPQNDDADYFIDCFEVVREFVEDGIALSGRTVCDGGLATAVRKMVTESLGIKLKLKGVSNSYKENDIVKILFSEVPGVVIQVSNEDLSYIDTQLLLQDVAYYNLGQVSEKHEGLVL